MDYILAKDPGISGTGLSIWEMKDWEKLVPPIACTNIYAQPGIDEWWIKCSSIWNKIESFIQPYHSGGNRIILCFSELPKSFDSTYGQAAAKEGSIVKLSVFIGYCLYGFHRLEIPVSYVDVNDWKGQLSKDLVEKRVDRLFPDLTISSHSYDSVGIGLYSKGFKLSGEKR